MALSTIFAVGGAVVKGIGGMQQANYQAKVAENNAIIAEDNAKTSIYESQLEAQELDSGAKADLGQLISTQGASGLDLGSGSFGKQRQALEELAAKDRGYTRTRGDIQAARFRQQSEDFTGAASTAKSSGRMAFIEGVLNIGTTLISGAARTNAEKARSIVA